jgi:hypothetical protein
LIIRNKAFSAIGLEAPTAAQINNIAIKTDYMVGEKVGGLWPIFALSETEIVAGRDNQHLDFRVSVLKLSEGDAAYAFVSTPCKAHNVFGKRYLSLIVPFHKFSVPRPIANAVIEDRL